MKELHKKFISQLFILSFVLYGVLYLVSSHISSARLPLAFMIALLFAVNSLAFIVVTNTKEKRPSGFVYSYMMVSLGRLILCCAYVFTYALLHKDGAKTFAVTFFVLYLLYTTVEVRALYTFFKN